MAKKKIAESTEEITNEIVEAVEQKQQTIEEMLLDYIDNLEGKKGDSVKINDFFTSLYLLPKSQQASLSIRETLVKASNEKKINIANNRQFDLGMSYYDNDGRAHKYNICNLDIFVEK
jgi:single-stranded DNA-specific DHH superfamily exonuclease